MLHLVLKGSCWVHLHCCHFVVVVVVVGEDALDLEVFKMGFYWKWNLFEKKVQPEKEREKQVETKRVKMRNVYMLNKHLNAHKEQIHQSGGVHSGPLSSPVHRV